jgi:hypothetical protein
MDVVFRKPTVNGKKIAMPGPCQSAQAMSDSQVMHHQKTVNLKMCNETIFNRISGSSERVSFQLEARIMEKPQKVQ